MLVKRVIDTKISCLWKMMAVSSIVANQTLLNNNCQYYSTFFKIKHKTQNPAIRSTLQSYYFCTKTKQVLKKHKGSNFLQNFAFNLEMNVVQFKALGILEKTTILLKILKNNQHPTMSIQELDKFIKIKQAFVQHINKLELKQQLEYFSLFISAFKNQLYSEVWEPYQKKQKQIKEFRNLVPAVDKYFKDFVLPEHKQQQQQQQQQFGNSSQDQLFHSQDIAHLLINFQCTQPSQQQKILKLAAGYLPQINLQVLSGFLADASYNHYQIPKQFFDSLYQDTQVEKLGWPFMYYLVTFADKYSEQYTPLMNIVQMNLISRSFFQRQISNIKQLFCHLQMKKLQNKFLNETQVRNVNVSIFYFIIHLQKMVQQKKYSIVNIIKILNIIGTFYPVGTKFLKEISFNKDAKFAGQQILDIKEYILRNTNNLKPNYIFSIDEKCLNQVNTPLLFIIQLLSRKVLLVDPYFLLEIPVLYTTLGEKIRNPLNLTTHQVLQKICEDYKQNRNPNILKKIINFVFQTSRQLQAHDVIKQAQQYVKNIQKLDNQDLQQWIFIFQTISLTKAEDRIQFKDFCQKFCIEYIKNNSQPRNLSVGINQSRNHEEYIIRIVQILYRRSQILSNNMIQLLTKFINNNYRYSVKSVKKLGVISLLNLLEKLPNVDVQIFGYLYNNLSSFVIFTQVNKKFYLPRGHRSYLKEKFVNVLKRAVKNYKKLRTIRKKTRLNLLKIIMHRFWNQFSNNQIAKFLMIFSSPTHLSNKIKQRLKQVKFTEQDLKKIDEIQNLRPFRFNNTQLLNYFKKQQNLFPHQESQHNKQSNQKYPQQPSYINLSQYQDLTHLNNKSAKELSQIFLNLQYYEQALQNVNITCQDSIPQPKTNDNRINMIYVCLKVFAKIKQHYDYRISTSTTNANHLHQKSVNKKYGSDKGNKNLPAIVDISQQIRYIKYNNLVKLDDINQFKLGNIQVQGNNTMIEGWFSYEAYDNLIEIQQYSNMAISDDNPYEKVLLSLYGDIGYIKQFTKKQAISSETIFAVMDIGLEAEQKGSLIQVTNLNKQKTVFLLCSNNSNYKIHTIFAYVLSKIGYECSIITQSHSKDQIKQFLKQSFELSDDFIKLAQQHKIISDSISKQDEQLSLSQFDEAINKSESEKKINSFSQFFKYNISE